MEAKKVMEIPIEKIVPNPYQPRRVFSQAALEELSNSIKSYGILQPITVRDINGNYELVAGERRFRAAKLANLEFVPAIINNMTDESSAVLALLENLQREDLEKEATILEYKKDPKYKELDKLIKEKINILNNNQLYIDYLKKMEDLNSILKESSTIIEKYLEENI